MFCCFYWYLGNDFLLSEDLSKNKSGETVGFNHDLCRTRSTHKKTRSAQALRVNGRVWRIGIF